MEANGKSKLSLLCLLLVSLKVWDKTWQINGCALICHLSAVESCGPTEFLVSCILSRPLHHDLFGILGKCFVRPYHAGFLPASPSVVS